jgi:hypothetical protein
VETELAKRLIAGDLRDGERILVEAGPGGLTFVSQGIAAEAAAARS